MTGYRKHQSGVVLIIGLLMLLLLTIIMISAVQVTALEETMAGNLQNHNMAFQAAETALREAEDLVQFRNTENDWDGDGVIDVASPFVNLSDGPFGRTTSPFCVAGMCTTTSPLQSEIFPNVDGGVYAEGAVNPGLKIAETGIATISEEPRYIVELISYTIEKDKPKGEAYFRVTASARGGDSNSLVRLQSILHVKLKIRKEWIVY